MVHPIIKRLTDRWTYRGVRTMSMDEDEFDLGRGESNPPEFQADEKPRHSLTNSREQSNVRCPVLLGLLVLSGCLVLTIMVVVIHTNPFSRKVWRDCGGDPETARARGCQFDVINFGWQTPECFDAALVAEFAELSPWTFWTSKYGNETVSHEVAYRGDRPLWTTWHHHLSHCTYSIRKMHRAYEAGWIEEHLRKYEHTEHCMEFLMLKGEETEDGRFFVAGEDRHLTYLNIVYPPCEKLESGTLKSKWWKGKKPRYP